MGITQKHRFLIKNRCFALASLARDAKNAFRLCPSLNYYVNAIEFVSTK
ncbi:MAG: hypothetical protein U5L45_04605 [Saprospiraceae bacterium]|nr:hypothetical protein [Saprospiraceae bacterium]